MTEEEAVERLQKCIADLVRSLDEWEEMGNFTFVEFKVLLQKQDERMGFYTPKFITIGEKEFYSLKH